MLAIRRLRYLEEKFPSADDKAAMSKWTPAVSREVQSYIQVLRGAQKEKASDIQRLAQKFASMDMDRLKAMLEQDKAGADDAKKEQE